MVALALLALAACASTDVQSAQDTAAINALEQSVQHAADQLDQEHDSAKRRVLIEQARRDADACLARAPHTAACQYADAMALGLQAGAHPLRFKGYLKKMLASLARADAADPNYDFAGPARVRAEVLVRAPGWPLGPGDPEAALAAAQRAVSLQPDYAGNWLVLAEAQTKTGATGDARASYERALSIAEPLPASPERDEWLKQAQHGLAAH
jgi:tetratricopeptide (TPR) repeat protein